MEQVRKETAQPYPRIIYNNDGNDTDGGDTPATFIANRLRQLPGTHVDTVFYEAWRAATMNLWHSGADGVYTFILAR